MPLENGVGVRLALEKYFTDRRSDLLSPLALRAGSEKIGFKKYNNEFSSYANIVRILIWNILYVNVSPETKDYVCHKVLISQCQVIKTCLAGIYWPALAGPRCLSVCSCNLSKYPDIQLSCYPGIKY